MGSREQVSIGEFGLFRVVSARKGVDCIDPRDELVHLGVRQLGAVRRPGGSMGKVMALMAELPNIDPKDAVNLVLTHDHLLGGHYYYHSAEDVYGHQEHSLLTGCGHVDLAAGDNSGRYGVSVDRIAEAVRYVRQSESRKKGIRMSVLTGVHRESAVVVVDSMTTTIDPVNEEHQLFRYDVARDHASLAVLADLAVRNKHDLTSNRLIERADAQTEISLSLLAGGFKIWMMRHSEGRKPKIRYMGLAPSATK